MPNRKPKFLHIEKTAGASISEMFGGHKPVDPNACVDVSLYGKHKKQIKDILKTSDDRVVMTLRDPADRIVSYYNWRVNKAGRDYDKDLKRVIKQGTPGPAEAEIFTMDDVSRFDYALEAPLPYEYYFDGVDMDDPRIRVLCLSGSMEDQLQTYAREQHCTTIPEKLPTLHKATHDETRLDPSFREFIYQKRASDKEIYDHFCTM